MSSQASVRSGAVTMQISADQGAPAHSAASGSQTTSSSQGSLLNTPAPSAGAQEGLLDTNDLATILPRVDAGLCPERKFTSIYPASEAMTVEHVESKRRPRKLTWVNLSIRSSARRAVIGNASEDDIKLSHWTPGRVFHPRTQLVQMLAKDAKVRRALSKRLGAPQYIQKVPPMHASALLADDPMELYDYTRLPDPSTDAARALSERGYAVENNREALDYPSAPLKRNGGRVHMTLAATILQYPVPLDVRRAVHRMQQYSVAGAASLFTPRGEDARRRMARALRRLNGEVSRYNNGSVSNVSSVFAARELSSSDQGLGYGNGMFGHAVPFEGIGVRENRIGALRNVIPSEGKSKTVKASSHSSTSTTLNNHNLVAVAARNLARKGHTSAGDAVQNIHTAPVLRSDGALNIQERMGSALPHPARRHEIAEHVAPTALAPFSRGRWLQSAGRVVRKVVRATPQTFATSDFNSKSDPSRTTVLVRRGSVVKQPQHLALNRLRRFVTGNAPFTPDYRFHQCYSRDFLLRYSAQEYDMSLRHFRWTRAQTDVLLRLVSELNERFVVVYDRWRCVVLAAHRVVMAMCAKNNNGGGASESASDGVAVGPWLKQVSEAVVGGKRPRSTLNGRSSSPRTKRRKTTTHSDAAGNTTDERLLVGVGMPSALEGKLRFEWLCDLLGPEHKPCVRSCPQSSAGKSGVVLDFGGVRDDLNYDSQTLYLRGGKGLVRTYANKANPNSRRMLCGCVLPFPLPVKQALRDPASFSIEDLKDRFFSVQRTLHQMRNSFDHQDNPSLLYNPVWEAYRRAELSKLWRRVPFQCEQISRAVVDRDAIVAQMRVLKKRYRSERKLHRIAEADRAKKFAAGAGRELEEMSNTVQSLPETGILAPIPASCVPGKSCFVARTPGCVLRSTGKAERLVYVTAEEAKFLESQLDRVGVRKTQFPVPTARCAYDIDDIRHEILILYRLQQHVHRTQAKLYQLRMRLRDRMQ